MLRNGQVRSFQHTLEDSRHSHKEQEEETKPRQRDCDKSPPSSRKLPIFLIMLLSATVPPIAFVSSQRRVSFARKTWLQGTDSVATDAMNGFAAHLFHRFCRRGTIMPPNRFWKKFVSKMYLLVRSDPTEPARFPAPRTGMLPPAGPLCFAAGIFLQHQGRCRSNDAAPLPRQYRQTHAVSCPLPTSAFAPER